MGTGLSGGQRKRVLLAKALYREPNLLFLNEGTASLDQETEAGIVGLIARMSVTRIVVAHRPALIEAADKVYRVADGKVVCIRCIRSVQVTWAAG